MSIISANGHHAGGGNGYEHSHPGHTFSAQRLELAYEGHTVVHDFDLDIPAHQVGAIIGPNGCGKSTLLKALARLLKPKSGSVLLDGKPISALPTKQVATIVGLLPQTPTAPEGITVADLIARGRYPYHGLAAGWTHEDERAMAHALAVTGLASKADRAIDELSGGQRQRAWIALTLAQETDILLLDEPTTYLDVAYQLEVLDLLGDLNQQEGVTVVMVLHDLNMAARYADWILAMKDGRKAAFGTPQEVITRTLVRDVFAVDADVSIDPATGAPFMSPDSSHSLRERRRCQLGNGVAGVGVAGVGVATESAAADIAASRTYPAQSQLSQIEGREQ
ncbi:ABC transporter ATP-binding protein [Bifidobacterium subtile]|jgi:iron complex transport system ATP-binding protein|uniref:ABC transporter, ATP binding protein, probably Coelichelin uptake porter (Iron Chelate Uptake) n=1 Tax=Bifidobacterium subtile TaxID=77635 RepID=A0A087DTR9_9BIFI|nr:ABC transporter ATP-binding protein [Bifidobacterium subtile]KFI98919.1 ABC transporter, ATP binding protein, probably Coelichelin uptake porter (Iron Chelate Uptake) [Bifidobacterium subtile]MCI1223290.1 ABC transporter ATP-binding protein [Bifidobacterium subtile]MCI1241925.1 ABC transporter ATP-binding protein [Bifidobacterium subtile]MCI1258666.1 ABC transporter ATP-binding protein [Bifidobacterium subtile]QOL36393.1 ABC transporter ATP-binding protein [Bifidobacterium subtile]